MKILADPLPRQWRVTLKDGSVIGVWANAYGEKDEHHTFEIVAEAPPAEQADDDVVISAKWPSNPERFMFVVARIPTELVADVETAHWGGSE
jgi:hypothetical protein